MLVTGKGFKTNQQPQEFSTIAQTFPSSTIPPRIETFRKEPTIEYSTGTDRFAPQQTTSPRIITFSSTEPVNRNTASLPTAPDNSLTTVYGPGKLLKLTFFQNPINTTKIFHPQNETPKSPKNRKQGKI